MSKLHGSRIAQNRRPRHVILLIVPDARADLPEYALKGRYELAMRWAPAGVGRLLDAGCAWGYGTRHFTTKSREVIGLEPNATSAALFRARYPHMQIVESAMERVPLETASFDVILALDVLEHVCDEHQSLAELDRLLKVGGVLVITTPHRGAFGFLDRDNLVPRVGAALRRLVPRFDRGQGRPLRVSHRPPSPTRPFHRHYSLGDLQRLLDASFRGRYEITDVFRSGLFLEAFTADLAVILGLVAPKRLAEHLLRPIASLSDRDFWIQYGLASYNIAIRIVKIV